MIFQISCYFTNLTITTSDDGNSTMHFDVLLPANYDLEENQEDEEKSDGEKASAFKNKKGELTNNLLKEFEEVYQNERNHKKQRATKLDFSGNFLETTLGV